MITRFTPQRGFSLMELIAVMAILAILSAVLAPSLVDGVDRAYAAAEVSNLSQLADDLERYIRDTGQIPGRAAASWSAAIASVSNRPLDQVLNNRRGHQRFVYFDPEFLSTTGASFNGYVQSVGLSSAPNSPRIMLISNLKGRIANQPTDSARFDAIWNQASGAALVESADLKIQRMHLSGMFHQVLLSNSGAASVAFSLGGGAATPIAASASGVDGIASRYVIDGSALNLFGGPYPTGALMSAQIVTQASSLRYSDDGAQPRWDVP